MRANRKKVILTITIFSFLSPIAGFSQGEASVTETPKEKKYAFSGTDRDPLSPLVSENGLILIPREIDTTEELGVTDLTLGGIIYSEKEPVAIINGEVMEEGDSDLNYTVLKIEEKKVIVQRGDEKFTLELEEQY